MKKLALLLSLVLIATPAYSAEWFEIYRDNKGVSFIDLQSVKKSTYKGQNIVGAWDMAEYPNGKWVGGRYVYTSKGFGWFDCRNETMSNVTSFASYDKNNKVVKTEQSPIKGFSPAIPESYGELLMDMACSQAMFNDFIKYGGIKMSKKQEQKLRYDYPRQTQGLTKKQIENAVNDAIFESSL